MGGGHEGGGGGGGGGGELLLLLLLLLLSLLLLLLLLLGEEAAGHLKLKLVHLTERLEAHQARAAAAARLVRGPQGRPCRRP